MASENIRQEEKHKTLQDAVDNAYMISVIATTELEENIKYKIGSFLVIYQAFQNAFTGLFILTKNEPEMAGQHKDLIVKIDHWQHNGSAIRRFNGGNKKVVKDGIKLLLEWHGAIRSRGVITL